MGNILFYMPFSTRFIFIGILIINYVFAPTAEIEFKESRDSLEGPDRGFYKQIYTYEMDDLEYIREDGFKLVLLAFDIRDYLNTPIPDSKMEELESALKIADSLGIKVIFRAAYGFDRNYTDPDDVYEIIKHIVQIGPVLNRYKDTILSVQAGFIGPWGEWHSSKFFTGDEEETAFRNKVLEAMLQMYDESIVINLRRPKFIQEAVAAGMDIKRLGFHDDGLLGSATDVGTYDGSREDNLVWMRENISHGINGGEMNRISNYVTLENANKEFRQIGITYLNKFYNEDVLDIWRNAEIRGQNGLKYMGNHLGYRYFVSKVNASSYLEKYGKVDVDITLENTGFAPIREGYNMYIVMKQGDQIIVNTLLSENLYTQLGGDESIYSFSTPLSELLIEDSEDPIKIGVYITRNEPDLDLGKQKYTHYGVVEFANLPNSYEKGINYFINYTFNDGVYELEIDN